MPVDTLLHLRPIPRQEERPPSQAPNSPTRYAPSLPARSLLCSTVAMRAGSASRKEATSPEVKALPESYYEALKSGRGRVILASSRSTEFSYMRPGAANGLFTQHLFAGLRGGVPGPGGVIRIFDLFHYLQPRVTSDQPYQHPIFKAAVEENFPIALYLGGKMLAPMASASPADHFTYDVFISYRQQEPDRELGPQDSAAPAESRRVACLH